MDWGFDLPDRGFRPNGAVLLMVGNMVGEFSLICELEEKEIRVKNMKQNYVSFSTV